MTIFILEAQMPLPVPIPGIKLGLSNIVTLFAILYLTPKEAFLILIGRILLGSIFTGNPSVLLYSLSGGLSSIIVEMLLLKLLGKKFIAEISAAGAMAHNAVQILCAVLITQSFSVLSYLPFLMISGFLTGTLCGLCILGIDKHFSFGIINLIYKNKK